MGNIESTSTSSLSEDSQSINLAMMAVARNFQLKQEQLIALRTVLASHADRNGIVRKESFERALELFKLSNLELFDLLFTMWDSRGEDKVPFKGFCVGISPLACPYDDIGTVLSFALKVCDDRNLGFIRPYDLQCLLEGKCSKDLSQYKIAGSSHTCMVFAAINSTASYFGDAHLNAEEIDAIVESIFEGGGYIVSHMDCVRGLALNPYVRRFASGKARTHVQFKTELVTEIKIEPRYKMFSRKALLDHRFLPSRQRGGNCTLKRLSPRTNRRVGSLVDSVPSWEEESENIKPGSIDPPSSLHLHYQHHHHLRHHQMVSSSQRQAVDP